MFISLSSTMSFSLQISEMSVETRRLSLFPFLCDKIFWLMQTKGEKVYFHSQLHITIHHSGKVAVVGGWGSEWHQVRNRKRWMCTCWISTHASTYTALVWSRNKIGLHVSTKKNQNSLPQTFSEDPLSRDSRVCQFYNANHHHESVGCDSNWKGWS